MYATLSTNNIPFLKAFLFLKTRLSLDELGTHIAARLLPGLTFSGKEDYIRDEIPAVYIKGIFGCILILQGNSEAGYNLVLETFKFPHTHMKNQGATPQEVDMSGLLAYLLEDMEDVEIEFV